MSTVAKAEPLGIKNLFRVSVPEKWRGAVVAARFGHTSWRLCNLPNVLALQPFEYEE